jgi:sodium-dependent dicarboxylate transporter 2/3/5
MTKRQTTGLITAALILIISCLIPQSEVISGLGLSLAGVRTIALLLAFLVTLITEAAPVLISCLIFLGLMPLLGVSTNFGQALSGYTNPVVFFVLASYGMAAAFSSVPLPKRILRVLLKRFGKSSDSIIFAVMLCTALVSSILSNVPNCAIFMALSLKLLDMYEEGEARKKAGRALMLAVPVATMIGGCITPAGSSVSLMAISMLEQYTGKTISFIQWTLIGLPFAALSLPVSWYLICRIHKPAPISQEAVDNFISGLDIPRRMDGREKRVIAFFALLLALFLLSSWVRSINIMIVSVLGCCLMCLPFVKVLDYKSFYNSINWPSIILIGTVLSMGDAIVYNGVSVWLASLMPLSPLPVYFLVAFAALLTFVLLVVVPVSLSLVTILTAPLIALAAGSGVSPELVMLVLGVCGGCCFLLPLDVVPLLTYGTGYYSMTDCFKSSAPIQVFLIVVMSVLFPAAAKIFGWI